MASFVIEVKRSQIVQATGDIWMVLTKGSCSDVERPLVQLLRLFISPQVINEASKTVKCRHYFQVIIPVFIFIDLQAPPIEWLSLRVSASLAVEVRQIVQTCSRVDMVQTVNLFVD